MLSSNEERLINELVNAENASQLKFKGELARIVNESPKRIDDILIALFERIDIFINKKVGCMDGVIAAANIFHSRSSVFFQLASPQTQGLMMKKSKYLESVGLPCPF